IEPLGFSPEGNLLVQARGGKDTMGIYSFDPESRELGRCHWQNDRFDPLAPMTTLDGRLVGVLYQAERLGIEWLDDHFRMVQAKADEALAGTTNVLINSTRDGTKHLFRAFSD